MKQCCFFLGSMFFVFKRQIFPFLTANGSQKGHLDEPIFFCFCKISKIALEAGLKHDWGVFNTLNLSS